MFFMLLGATAWWWILVDLVALALLIGLVETNHPWFGGLLLLVVWPAALFYFAQFNVYIYAYEHLADFVMYVLVYVGIGFVWSLIKYWFKVNNDDMQDQIKYKYSEYNRLYSYKAGEAIITVEEWAKKPGENPAHPLNARMRDKILGWWGWWPISVFSTVTREFFLRLFENLFNLLKNVYMLIAKAAITRAFKG